MEAIALPQNTRPSPSGPQRTPSPNQSTVSHRTAVIAAVCVVAACTLLLIVLWRTWRVRRPSPPLLQVSLEKPRLWDILSVRADAKAEPWTMWARMLPLSVMRPGEVLLGCTPPRQDGYASKPSRTDGILQVVVVIEMPAQRRYKGQKAQGASASGQSIQDMGGLWVGAIEVPCPVEVITMDV